MSGGLDPIQVLWVRGNLSRMEQLSIHSFLAHGHPVHFYSYEPGDNLPAGVVVHDAAKIVPEALAPGTDKTAFSKGSYGAFSDFFRYNLLFTNGGWWADLDVVAIRPWSNFPEVVAASTEEKGHGRIANGFVMRFPAGHEVMRRCLEAIPLERLPQMGIDETGPLLLHKILEVSGVKSHCQPPHVFAPVPWNASWQLLRAWRERLSVGELKQRLRRPHLSMRFRPDTAAIHLWNEMWKQEGYNKAKCYSRSCLYEKLQRKYNPEEQCGSEGPKWRSRAKS